MLERKFVVDEEHMPGLGGYDDYGGQHFFNRKHAGEINLQQRMKNTEVDYRQGMEEKGENDNTAIWGSRRYGVHFGHAQSGHNQSGHVQPGHWQSGHVQPGHRQSGFEQFGPSQFGNAQFGNAQFASAHIGAAHFGAAHCGAAYFEEGHFGTGGVGLMRGWERRGFGAGTGFDLEIMFLCLNIEFVGHNYGGYGDSFNSGLQNARFETDESGEFSWHQGQH